MCPWTKPLLPGYLITISSWHSVGTNSGFKIKIKFTLHSLVVTMNSVTTDFSNPYPRTPSIPRKAEKKNKQNSRKKKWINAYETVKLEFLLHFPGT